MTVQPKSNGRVNLLETNDGTAFFLNDKIAVNDKTNFKNIMKYSITETPLIRAYYSKDNVQLIQNGIRAGVYNMSNKKYLIDEQSSETLNVIMRSIYLQYSVNMTNNIRAQIETLNKLILDYCVPKIYSEVKGYMQYRIDASTLAIPLNPPVLSSNKNNSLELKNFF